MQRRAVCRPPFVSGGRRDRFRALRKNRKHDSDLRSFGQARASVTLGRRAPRGLPAPRARVRGWRNVEAVTPRPRENVRRGRRRGAFRNSQLGVVSRRDTHGLAGPSGSAPASMAPGAAAGLWAPAPDSGPSAERRDTLSVITGNATTDALAPSRRRSTRPRALRYAYKHSAGGVLLHR